LNGKHLNSVICNFYAIPGPSVRMIAFFSTFKDKKKVQDFQEFQDEWEACH